MRLLLDTNIFLEVLLNQERSEEARQLIARVGEHEMFISDFSLHSIGLILFSRRRFEVFNQLLHDVVANAAVSVLSLSVGEMTQMAERARRFSLDFDDAYQYIIATSHDLTLVSFDADFDRTDLERRTPSEIG